jgi:hypothetical protein
MSNGQIQSHISSYGPKNFVFQFSNGYSVSIAYGEGSYSDAKNRTENLDELNSVEVAVFDPNGDFVPFQSTTDQVLGYVTPDMVADILAWTKNLPEEVALYDLTGENNGHSGQVAAQVS